MPVIFTFNVISTQTIAGVFRTKGAGNAITVDWGDGGATQDFAGTSDQAYSKDYGSAGNRTVKISAADESVMTRFTMLTEGANIGGTLVMPSGMTFFQCRGSNTFSGTLSIPSGMAFFNCEGSNTLSGALSLPFGMTNFNCQGSNTLSGTLSIPSGMTLFICLGSNTLSGTLSIPSGMTNFQCSGSNTLSGTLSLPSGITLFSCQGSNTLSGTLSIPSGMTLFICLGSNTLRRGGPYTFPANMSRFSIISSSGNNLSSKDVDAFLVELAATTWAGTTKRVDLTGTAIAKRTIFSDAANTTLTAALLTYNTNGRVADIASGTLTAGKLYRVGKTDDGRFYSLAAGKYFTSNGTEECNATNTVLEVKNVQRTGLLMVSASGGTTRDMAKVDAGFDRNAVTKAEFIGVP
jgi:hypothetical protein